MATDIFEFLKRFTSDELAERGILRGETFLLNKGSVSPLIKLMKDEKVTLLHATDRRWYLTANRQFSNPLAGEAKSGNVDDLENPGNLFRLQNVYITPHYRGGDPPDEGIENDEPTDLNFGLERDLQTALRKNIGDLEDGLKIIDDGIEKTVEAGRIDILAEDKDGYRVVIELKADRAPLPAMGQILSYMGSVREEDPSQRVRGILIANDFHPKLELAAKAVPNVELVAYSFKFDFEPRLSKS